MPPEPTRAPTRATKPRLGSEMTRRLDEEFDDYLVQIYDAERNEWISIDSPKTLVMARAEAVRRAGLGLPSRICCIERFPSYPD